MIVLATCYRHGYMRMLEVEFAALGLEVYSQNFSARRLISFADSEVSCELSFS